MLPVKGNVVLAAVLYVPTLTPESMPLTNTFKPVRAVTAAPALLGAAVNVKLLPVEATLVKEDATGAVFTRNTVSLFNSTLVVPNVLGEDELLGL